MLSSSHIAENQGLLSTLEVHPATMLAPFRAYAHYWDSKNTSSTGTSGQGGGELTSYMHVWQAYYNTLSILAQRGTVQPAFESKLEQGFELKRVEAVLEDILQKEFSFPKADQANTQVDSWVDQVMANWRVMCGSTWQDVDLVNNDKAAVGQGVLDVGLRKQVFRMIVLMPGT